MSSFFEKQPYEYKIKVTTKHAFRFLQSVNFFIEPDSQNGIILLSFMT